MPITNALASVAVKNLTSSLNWYEKLFKKRPYHTMPEVAEWGFERGGRVQVYQLPERAGKGSFTLVVTNIDDQVQHLNKLNIDTSERVANDQVKTVMITDPDGNHIAFAEPLDPAMNQ